MQYTFFYLELGIKINLFSESFLFKLILLNEWMIDGSGESFAH